MSPLAWMLSQGDRERLLAGDRRRCRAAVTKPNTELGGSVDWTSAMILGLLVSNSPVTRWMLYPPSVMVSRAKLLVARSAILAMTASGSSGA